MNKKATHTWDTTQGQATDANARKASGQRRQSAELALLDLVPVCELWKVTLDQTTGAGKAAKERHRILLQKAKQSRDDRDGQSTNRVGSGDLSEDLATVKNESYGRNLHRG